MRQTLCVAVCVLAAGCVTSRLQRLDPEVRPAQAPQSIVVFEHEPGRPYTIIARVESKANTVFKGFDDLRAEIIDRAAELGGDAVIVGPESRETEFIILATGMVTSEKKKLAGEVIVFP